MSRARLLLTAAVWLGLVPLAVAAPDDSGDEGETAANR